MRLLEAMRMRSTPAVKVWAAVIILSVSIAVLPAVAAEASDECPDPGQALPVVVVHGFSSNSDELHGLAETLAAAPVDLFVDRFDYRDNNTDWVGHDAIGTALRARIRCLADASMQAGGPGRVAVIGHSMGGLAARQALADHGDGGGSLSDQVALVATLGTPNDGSPWAGPALTDLNSPEGVFRAALRTVYERTFRKALILPRVDNPAGRALAVGSRELGDLAEFANDVPVFASAGQFVGQPRLLFYTADRHVTVGDVIVPSSSATSRAQTVDGLGGTDVVTCRTDLPLDLGPGSAAAAVITTMAVNPWFLDCAHTRLPDSELHVTPIVTQLVVASAQPQRRPAAQPAEHSIIAERWGPWGPTGESMGSDRAVGSGCSPGTPDTFPDGVWFGFVADLTATSAEFDLACLYTGEEAYARGADPEGADIWMENYNVALRTLPVADHARFFLHADGYLATPVKRVGFDAGDVTAFWAHLDGRSPGWGEWWREHVGVWVLFEDGELVEILEFWYGHVS